MGRIRNGIGEQRFLEGLQAELPSGAYRPSPARRKLIPKAGKPGQFRPLGSGQAWAKASVLLPMRVQRSFRRWEACLGRDYSQGTKREEAMQNGVLLTFAGAAPAKPVEQWRRKRRQTEICIPISIARLSGMQKWSDASLADRASAIKK